MLTQQFFTRIQLAKILDFKSDSSIKHFEKKGFITPQIKPSKYTFNQVLFMMICKELTDFADFSWKYLIEEIGFTCILEKNLIDYDLLYLCYFKSTRRLYVRVYNEDDNLLLNLDDYLDSGLSLIVSKLKENEDDTNDDIPNFCTFYDKNCIYLLFPIDRMYQKLQHKCTELKIDLKEKISV